MKTKTLLAFFGCGLASVSVAAGDEPPLVSAGTQIRVSTGPEVRLQNLRIAARYRNGSLVSEDKASMTLELDGRSFRLPKPNVELSGTVQAFDEETLTLALEKQASPVVIPRDAIAKLETVLGRRGHAKQGAIIGGAIGASLVIAACASFGDSCDLGGAVGPVAAYVGAFTGVGALIGAAIRSDRWVVATMPSVRAGSRVERRPGLRFSLGLRY